jgi:hypothetical protein
MAMNQLGSLLAVDPNTSNVSEKPRPQVLFVDIVRYSNALPSGLKRYAPCRNCIFLPFISPSKPEYPTTPQISLSGAYWRFDITACVSRTPQPVLSTCRTSALSSPLVSFRKWTFGAAATMTPPLANVRLVGRLM